MPVLGAIAGIDAIIVALVALIFLYATFPVWRPIVNAVLSYVPLVGWWFAQQTDALIWRIWNWVSGWTEQAVFTLVTVIQHAALIPLYLAWDTLGAINTIISALIRLGFQWLPAFAMQQQDYARAQAGLIQQWAQSTFIAVEDDYKARIGAVQAWANSTFLAVEDDYKGLIGAVQTWANSTFLAVEADYQGLIVGARADAAAAVAALGVAVNGALAALRADTLAGLGALRALEQADVAAVAGLAGRLADQAQAGANRHSDALAASGAAALAVVGAAVTKLERSPCIQRCDVLGDLGNGLQDLEDAGLLAALLGLAVEFERDGPGTARALWADLGAPLGELVTTTRELAGV